MRKQKISAKYVFSWNFPVWRIFHIVGWNRLQHNAFNWYVKSLLVKSCKFKRNFKFMGPFLHFLPFLIKQWILSSPHLHIPLLLYRKKLLKPYHAFIEWWWKIKSSERVAYNYELCATRSKKCIDRSMISILYI